MGVSEPNMGVSEPNMGISQPNMGTSKSNKGWYFLDQYDQEIILNDISISEHDRPTPEPSCGTISRFVTMRLSLNRSDNNVYNHC